jgi:branched-chain amino acid transport system substrate-binding protein
MFKRLLIALALIGGVAWLPAERADSNPPILIGALLPLTGDLSSYGETSHAALLDAVAEINARGLRQVELLVADTQTDPARAADLLLAFARQGIKVVIGPYSSSEVRAAKPIADP